MGQQQAADGRVRKMIQELEDLAQLIEDPRWDKGKVEINWAGRRVFVKVCELIPKPEEQAR